jgi:hypothetical protein
MNIKVTRAGRRITRTGPLRRWARNPLGAVGDPALASRLEQLGTVCFGSLGASEQLALKAVIADDGGAPRVAVPPPPDLGCMDRPE